MQIGDLISILVLPPREKVKKKPPSYIKREEVDNFKNNQILFETDHILIVSKYCGQTVQSNNLESSTSLETLLQSYSSSTGKSGYKYKFVHRLDVPVSGLLIGAKTAKAHNLLSESLKKKQIQKFYLALIFGILSKKTQKRSDWIYDKGKRVTVSDESNPSSKFSELIITQSKSYHTFSLIELQLITGRKNQIRAQLSNIEHPILGDRKYYSEKLKKIYKLDLNSFPFSRFNKKKIALVAYKLIFPETIVNELKLPWTAFELPAEKNIILTTLQKTKND